MRLPTQSCVANSGSCSCSRNSPMGCSTTASRSRSRCRNRNCFGRLAAILVLQLLAICDLPLPQCPMGRSGLITIAHAQAHISLRDLARFLTADGATADQAGDGIADGGDSSGDSSGGDSSSTSDGGGDAAAAATTVISSSSNSDGYSALCVVAKNENPYIREWVEYHKCLGFGRIYLYDHNSTVPLKDEIAEHVESGFVVYHNYSAAHTKFKEGYTSDLDRFMSTVQGQAYKDCVDAYSGRHTYLGFIDVDEFLVIYDPAIKTVDDLLREYEQHPGLSIYWVLLGSSGHKERPSGSVVDQYKACTPHDHKFNTQFKTFANTRFRPVMYSPHRAVFAAPADPKTGLEPYMVDENHNRVPRGRNKNSTHTRAAVFHYVTKSLVDFTEKMQRGGGAGVTRPTYYFDLMNKYSKEKCEGAVETRQRFCGGKLPDKLSAIVGAAGSTARR